MKEKSGSSALTMSLQVHIFNSMSNMPFNSHHTYFLAPSFRDLLFFAVLFVISLSDFNQMLYEDDTTNRMRESQKLFDEILNSIFFQKTPFIVFFNKVDLFREKLRSHILADYLPDYGGPNDFEPAL